MQLRQLPLSHQHNPQVADRTQCVRVLRAQHATPRLQNLALQQLRDVDVLITTPHMNFPHELQAAVKFHRIVVDESHLLDAEKAVSTIPSKLEALLRFQTSNLWLVTGTPFTTSLSQLQNQCWLLGQVELLGTVTGQQYAYPPPTNEEVVSALRKLMVRHTKSQQIRGEVALVFNDKDQLSSHVFSSPAPSVDSGRCLRKV